MSTIQRFEDIEAWREARKLAGAIYAVSDDGAFSRDFGLRDQVRRAAVSVMSNIAEGYERGGRVEFRRYLSMAKGSAGEVRSQLYFALDAGLVDRTAFETLHGQAEAVSRLIAGLMRYLANAPISK